VEKLKNALGVPPELDDDDDETDEEVKLDIKDFGKGHKPEGESAVDATKMRNYLSHFHPWMTGSSL